jgi:hypothetical protein
MVSGTAKLIVRAIGLAPVVACLFGGYACSGTLGRSPTPTATATTRPTATPTSAPTSTPPPPTPTLSSTPNLAATATTNARRTDCERYVAFLSGHGQDDALLDNPGVQALAQQSPDLTTCGAVLRDSDERCKRLLPAEHGPSMLCRQMRAIFHELRTYPKGRSFMFDDLDWEQCQSISGLPPKACDAFRDALRSADATKCAATGEGQSICRAFIRLDASLCGAMPGAQRRLSEGTHAKSDKGFRFEEGCKKAIESKKFLAQGLNALAESGPPRERELAKAALGRDGACAAYVQPALQLCMGSPAAPIPGTPGSPGPLAAPPGPAPAGSGTPAATPPAGAQGKS